MADKTYIQYHLKIGTLVLFAGNSNGIIISRLDAYYYEVLHLGTIWKIHRDDLIEAD